MTPRNPTAGPAGARRATLAAGGLALAVGIASFGCAAPQAERPLVGQLAPGVALAEMPRITLDKPELASFLEFGEPTVTRGGNDAGLAVSVPVTNAGPYDYAIETRFYFYSEDGELLTSTRGRELRVGSGETKTFRSSTDDEGAAEWRAHVSWAD
jgi:hypothetical protein